MTESRVRVVNSLIVKGSVRVGIQTWGSEGDIRPFVALGHALAARGHDVELLYTEIGDRRYEAVATALGFTARAVASPVISNRDELFEIGLKALYTRNQLRQGRDINRALLEPVSEPMFEAGRELCRRSDVVVQHFFLYPARAAADLERTPVITVAFAPMLAPSRNIRPHGMPPLGKWANMIEWRIAQFALNQTLLKDLNRFRAGVGLPRFNDLLLDAWPSPRLHLLAASPAMLDRPPDWPSAHQLCGFLALPPHEHEALDPQVEQFLAAGPPPVFMGFGSLMPPVGGTYLLDTVRLMTEAAHIAGVRAIIQSEARISSTADILHVTRAPHAQVFPRCAGVVHHAGAGTTHTTLAAGVPSVPVPHVSDQFLWSDELRRLGVATRPLPRTGLTAKRLGARIREAIGNHAMKQAALGLQARMQSDNGPATAAGLIERAMLA
jgi:sterol 3beta-glucosyltransferase/vancomycin aglycone glucosyltransferase